MYPKMVFKSPGDQVLPGGKSYGYQAVNSDDEADAAVADGWFRTVPEAVAGKLDEVVAQEHVEVPPTREELEAKASELGIRFTKRTTDAELGETIAAKLAE
jgi:hypothetical protein